MMGMTVGPVVPPANQLSCTYSSAVNLADSFCGATATLHAYIDGAEDDGSVGSVFACADHAPLVVAVAFTTHEVGGDCGMPGSAMNWQQTEVGVVSWCDYPEEDPALTVQVHQPAPLIAGGE